MFIESSHPRITGDVAQLESPRLTSETHCFTMWYHMNGRNIGRLAVISLLLQDRKIKEFVMLE